MHLEHVRRDRKRGNSGQPQHRLAPSGAFSVLMVVYCSGQSSGTKTLVELKFSFPGGKIWLQHQSVNSFAPDKFPPRHAGLNRVFQRFAD